MALTFMGVGYDKWFAAMVSSILILSFSVTGYE